VLKSAAAEGDALRTSLAAAAREAAAARGAAAEGAAWRLRGEAAEAGAAAARGEAAAARQAAATADERLRAAEEEMDRVAGTLPLNPIPCLLNLGGGRARSGARAVRVAAHRGARLPTQGALRRRPGADRARRRRAAGAVEEERARRGAAARAHAEELGALHARAPSAWPPALVAQREAAAAEARLPLRGERGRALSAPSLAVYMGRAHERRRDAAVLGAVRARSLQFVRAAAHGAPRTPALEVPRSTIRTAARPRFMRRPRAPPEAHVRRAGGGGRRGRGCGRRRGCR